MRPVVLVTRNGHGSAYHYTRYEGHKDTHIVHLDPVPVGETLPVLSPPHVELLRFNPEAFFKET